MGSVDAVRKLEKKIGETHMWFVQGDKEDQWYTAEDWQEKFFNTAVSLVSSTSNPTVKSKTRNGKWPYSFTTAYVDNAMLDSIYHRPIWVLENTSTKRKRLVMKCELKCPLYLHKGATTSEEIELLREGAFEHWQKITYATNGIHKRKRKLKILVIGPGMGLLMNPKRLEQLKSNYEVEVVKGAREGYGPGSGYPKEWSTGKPLIVKGEFNLATLATKVIERINLATPDVILCGSRGGQVTIGPVWEAMVQHQIPIVPTVVLNAGCINVIQKGSIPRDMKLVLVTGGQDYFSTKDPNVVKTFISERAASSGLNNTHHFHSDLAGHELAPYFEDNMDTIIEKAAVRQ